MITESDVIRDLDEIVEEYGANTRYSDRIRDICGQDSAEMAGYELADDGCQYTLRGQPACIIGVWLAKHGIIIPEDSLYNHTAWSVYPHGVADEFNAPVMTEDAAKTLRAAQRAQDMGAPWGEAANRARRYLER